MAKGADLKYENRKKVKACFYQGDVLTKNKIIKATDLSNGATTNILQDMLAHQEILLTGEADSTGGRKSKQYILNQDQVHVAAIIIRKHQDTNEIDVAITRIKGEVIKRDTYFENERLPEKILEIIVKLRQIDPLVKVVAISIPGVVLDGKIGICDCEQLVGWDIKEAIADRSGLITIVENDVNLAAVGFYQDHCDSLAVAMLYQPREKYVGCGMVLNHQLFKGANSFAGELAYLPFLDFATQERLLKGNPQELLKTQLVSLCAVVNPEVVGICSDNFKDTPQWDLSDLLPKTHWPKVVWAQDFYELVQRGLSAAACDYLISNDI